MPVSPVTIVLPDSEAVVVGFIKAHSALAALSGSNVATVIQQSWTGYAIRVTRVAGTSLSWQVDSPRIQIDCWAGKDDADGAQAALLASTVAATIIDLNGQHGATWICNATVADGPVAEADDQNRPRYRVDITFDIANH